MVGFDKMDDAIEVDMTHIGDQILRNVESVGPLVLTLKDGETASTWPSEQTEQIDYDAIMEAMKEISDSCPLQQFAKSHGYDLDAGDFMVMPKAFSHLVDRRGVRYLELADAIYLMKTPDKWAIKS